MKNKTTTKEQNENRITEQEAPADLEQLEQAEQVAPDVIYQNNIYALVDDVKQLPQFVKKSDEELKENKAFFPILVKYIYDNYIGNLLGNKHGKQVIYRDIYTIDKLFDIYTELVMFYKWNNRPLIIEFSLFTGISRDTIYKWLNGDTTIDNNSNNIISDTGGNISKYNLTREKSAIVQKWIGTCERALIDGNDTIKDIFILKAKHGYKDNNNDIQITVNHKQIVSSDDLPALIGVGDSKKDSQ